MRFDDLKPHQQAIVKVIERVFLVNKGIKQYDFTIALAYLLNKYKIKKQTED